MSYVVYDAILDGEIDVLQNELANGVDFSHITENDRWSYLHKAFKSLDEKVPVESVQFLLDQGLDVNAIDSYGNTPLIYAVRQRNADGMRLLLENGADRLIDHRNLDKVNALRMGFKGKPFVYDVIKLLLDFGADPDSKTDTGKSFRELTNLLDDVDPEIKELVKQY